MNYLPSYKLLNIKTAIFPVVLHIKSTDFVQGRGCWKVNNSLPSDKEYMYMYIQTMQTQIIDTKKKQYSVLICNINKVQNIKDPEHYLRAYFLIHYEWK